MRSIALEGLFFWLGVFVLSFHFAGLLGLGLALMGSGLFNALLNS